MILLAHRSRRTVLLGSLLLITRRAYATSNFVVVETAPGIQLETPSDWKILSKPTRKRIDTAAEASASQTGGRWDTTLPLAMNAYNLHGKTVALLNVRTYSDQTVTQAEVRTLTSNDIATIDAEMRQNIEPGFIKQELILIKWQGTKLIDIGPWRVLLTKYRRASVAAPRNIFQVRLIRVLDGPDSFTLTISVSEREARLYEPVADRIQASLRPKVY